MLIQHGSNVTVADNLNDTALHLAATNGNFESWKRNMRKNKG